MAQTMVTLWEGELGVVDILISTLTSEHHGDTPWCVNKDISRKFTEELRSNEHFDSRHFTFFHLCLQVYGQHSYLWGP